MLRALDFRPYPRIYGRDNAFRKTVVDVKNLLVTRPKSEETYSYKHDFEDPFLICRIFRRLDQPQHLIRQAVTYLVNEKLLEKYIADKRLTFAFRMDGKSGHIEWNKKIGKWQFVHTSYERITRRKPNGRKSHIKYTNLEDRTNVPDSVWDGYMYVINNESDSYKEWVDFISQTPKEKICLKCGCKIEVDRKHHKSKCNRNIVKEVMDL